MEKYTFSNFNYFYYTFIYYNIVLLLIIMYTFYHSLLIVFCKYLCIVDKSYQKFNYCCVRVYMSCVVGPTPSLAPPNETPCSCSSVVT